MTPRPRLLALASLLALGCAADVDSSAALLELEVAREESPGDGGDRAAPHERGIWMHYHTGSSLGTGQIVGNATLEGQALTRLQSWNIARVYGGYKDLPVTNRAEVAAWNATLNAEGIDSQLLLGAPHHVFPGAECRDALLAQIDERMIGFHQGVGTVGGGPPMPLAAFERFDALHLDVEPQAFSASYYGTGGPPPCAPPADYWAVTPSRAQLLALLLETFEAVRAHLDAHGHGDVALYVDLPVWIDSSASIDWSDTPDFTFADDWLIALVGVVDGVTFMSYERDTAAAIRSSVLGERVTLLDSIDVRVAVNAKERHPWSSIHTWSSPAAMWAVVQDLETGTGLYGYGVDLHNYRYMALPWWLVPKPVPFDLLTRVGGVGAPVERR